VPSIQIPSEHERVESAVRTLQAKRRRVKVKIENAIKQIAEEEDIAVELALRYYRRDNQ
jgi:predicted nucleotide-binding protein (sugar kinase/HSP70/actin superfamily)